ncbi:MAG TPA: LysM peptidoglycan-binding domain-containing protein [Methylomirabilota bacterium]
MAVLVAALVLGACVTVPTKSELIRPARVRAKALERDGQLRPALLQWKVARAIDSNDAEARANEARLTARIEGLVAAKVAEARGAQQRNAPLQARRALLVALALDPMSTTVAELLRSIGDIEFVTYTVRAGDTLASLAERYYGDRARGEVIWETNNLPPGKTLVAGSVLRIPEIPGVPFYAPGRTPPPSGTAVAAVPPREERPVPPQERPTSPQERPTPSQDEPPEVNPLLADVRDAVERKEFATALADLDRYLAENPRDREGTELKKLTLYRQGQSALEEKKYDDSYRALTLLARLQPNYQDVARLLPQARRQVIDRHYQEGIRLFREEKLPEAIAEWKMVLDMEPQHVNARRNLDQAERLLKGLEQRKSR